jgi:hypothetical protein
MRCRAVMAALVVLPMLACAEDAPPAILVEERMLYVQNLTAGPWTGVEIWINDHYRVTRSTIAPGERVQVPLNLFVAGFGQRFDPVRTKVRGVEVTATLGDGPVRIAWGTGRRR